MALTDIKSLVFFVDGPLLPCMSTSFLKSTVNLASAYAYHQANCASSECTFLWQFGLVGYSCSFHHPQVPVSLFAIYYYIVTMVHVSPWQCEYTCILSCVVVRNGTSSSSGIEKIHAYLQFIM